MWAAGSATPPRPTTCPGEDSLAYFTLGCKSLTVRTDHQPLIPIINGTDMEKMRTPRQIRLKEKLLRWDLRVVYIPG